MVAPAACCRRGSVPGWGGELRAPQGRPSAEPTVAYGRCPLVPAAQGPSPRPTRAPQTQCSSEPCSPGSQVPRGCGVQSARLVYPSPGELLLCLRRPGPWRAAFSEAAVTALENRRGFRQTFPPATKTSLHASAKLGVCPAACMCVLCIFRVPEGFKFGPSGFARHRIGSGIKRYRTLAAAAWLRLGECCYYRKTAAGCRATLAFCKVGVLRVTQ